MENSNEIKPKASALLPILVFLVIYLGNGIYFEYISPVEGQMGFYIVSVVVAFGLALIVAFAQNRKLKFDEKIHLCAQGIGDDNITIMLFIFLMAGAFSGLAGAAGGAGSTANLLLTILPDKMAVPGIFIIACLISMSMGTSVGTIALLGPIALGISKSAGLDEALCLGTVVGGAMFGDNLSFISDTTIAATKTQGVEMKDKFRANFKIALPAALGTLIILVILSLSSDSASIGSLDYNLVLAMPYFIVLILALIGLNVFLVLGAGILLFIGAGAIEGTLTYSTAASAMGSGCNGMFETIIVTILVASISSLIKANGGFEAVLSFIRKVSKTKKGGMIGISALTGLMDVSTANNTVAIVVAAPLAKQISEEYGIEPKKTASLLDTVSCIFQGVIPYGAQLLVAAGIEGATVSSVHIMPYLFYPMLLTLCVIASIIFDQSSKKTNK